MIQMRKKLALPSVANIYLATQRLVTTILAFAVQATVILNELDQGLKHLQKTFLKRVK
jgi:hypothetical protein